MSAASSRGDWRAALRAAASQPPLRPREPLHLAAGAGSVLVGSIEAGVAERLRAARLPLRRLDGAWQVDAPAAASLAAIAAWLRDAGLAGHWRDELLAVVDAEERPLAEVERAAVRVLGLTTFAVHLVGHAFEGDGVWVQQRAFDKATDPGLWDTLMGGQVAAGETIETALERETWEEAGIALDSLLELRPGEALTFRRPVAEGYLVERIEVFHARLAEGVQPRNLDGEVAGFACLDRAALAEALARGEFTLEAASILAPLVAA